LRTKIICFDIPHCFLNQCLGLFGLVTNTLQAGYFGDTFETWWRA